MHFYCKQKSYKFRSLKYFSTTQFSLSITLLDIYKTSVIECVIECVIFQLKNSFVAINSFNWNINVKQMELILIQT